MRIEDKKMLAKLLNKYQDDLLIINERNKTNRAIQDYPYEKSVKSKYKYARIIKSELEKDIEKDIDPVY